jgi:hypothetical protein
VEICDAEWVVKRADTISNGYYSLSMTGISDWYAESKSDSLPRSTRSSPAFRRNGSGPGFVAAFRQRATLPQKPAGAIATDRLKLRKAIDLFEELDRAKEAVNELFSEAKGKNTHVIVERIVTNIDDSTGSRVA